MAVAGQYRLYISTPIGNKELVVTIADDESYGKLEGEGGVYEFTDFSVDGDSFKGSATLKTPMGDIATTLTCTVDGDDVRGDLITPYMPIAVTGERI